MNQSILDEIKSYLNSEVKDPNMAISLMQKIEQAGGEIYKIASESFAELLTAKESEKITEETAKCGYLALSQKDQQKLVGLMGSEEAAKELSYYEVMERLNGKDIVEISDSLEKMADEEDDINYVYALEKDLIEIEDLKKAISAGTDEEVNAFLARYFDGAGYEGTEKQKQMIVMGLGNRDIIVSNLVRLNEKSVENAIKKFERTTPNTKFATLDLSAQNRILAEFYDNSSEETHENADFTYITSLIKGKTNAKEKQQIAEKVMDSASVHGVSVNEEIFNSSSLRQLVGIENIDFKKIDLNRKVIECIDNKVFENLISAIIKDRFDETKEIVEQAKKRVIEKNIEKRKTNDFSYPTDLPNPIKMSMDRKRDFNYRVSLLNRHLRENPDSDILKNIFVNANLVNEQSMLNDMVSRQEELLKKSSKLLPEEVKQFLTTKTVNEYFSENQELKTLMLQIGANNLFLTFTENQLKPKILRAISKNGKLKFAAISHAYEMGKSEEALEKSLRSLLSLDKDYLITFGNRAKLVTKAAILTYLDKGKIIKDKEKEVYEAAKSLQSKDDDFARELYDYITEVVSYSSTASDEEQSRFFGDVKPFVRAKNISEALNTKQNVVLNKAKRFIRTIGNVSQIIGNPKAQISSPAKIRENQEFKRNVMIITDKINHLSTKQSGASYAESAKEILGQYYNRIYNSKNLITRLIGGEVSSESAVIQQRDIFRGLQIMQTQAMKKSESLSRYISAPYDISNDPRFIGKLTHKSGGKLSSKEFNIAMLSELSTTKKGKQIVATTKMQQDFMNKDEKYKAIVEEFNERYMRFKDASEELEQLRENLRALDTQVTKSADLRRKVKDLKTRISDAEKKLAVLEPYMQDAKDTKENYEKKFATKLDKEAKKQKVEPDFSISDIFSYQNIFLKGSTAPVNPETDAKLAMQIRKVTSQFISNMIGNIEKVNSTLKLIDAKPVVLKNTRLGGVVKQSGIIIKTLTDEIKKLSTDSEKLNKTSEEYKSKKAVLDRLNNDLARVKNDTKMLEDAFNKLGIGELKNK